MQCWPAHSLLAIETSVCRNQIQKCLFSEFLWLVFPARKQNNNFGLAVVQRFEKPAHPVFKGLSIQLRSTR